MAERPVTNPGTASLASAAAVPARGAASSLAEHSSTTGRVIRSLPTLLVNQIAAGEVVERPASVVKELLENALDASASRIDIELEQGGIELIRITDDGCGIDAGQLPMALAPHATSKLRDVSELERIATMGFRGEALASITSVSRLSIRSRTAAAVGAAIIEAEGDSVKPVAPVAGPVGTQVTVRNLFFNTPARRKFLRTPATEQSRCADAIRDAAMAHCAVAFRLVCDGRTVIDVPPGQSPRERIVAILGKELGDQLLDVSGEVDGYVPWKAAVGGPNATAAADPATAEPMTVWGLAGLPSIARATAQAQHVFVNGRPIRDRTIMHAIKEAYRGLIEPGRHPTAVLLLEMDPAAVDVNVHPTKSEVRFRESSRIHSLVLRSIQDALRRADLTPAVRQPGGGGGGGIGAGGGFGALGILPAAGGGTGSGGAGGSGGGGPAAFAEYFRRELPASAGGRLDFDAIRAAVQHAPGGAAAAGPAAANASAAHGAMPWGVGGAHAPFAPPLDPSLPVPVPVRPIVQVHNSYLVTQDEQGMLIVDQHALHERVMFEKLLARVTRERGDAAAGAEGGACLESQRLLTPTVIPASPAQVDSLDALRGLLDRIGVAAEPIGPTSIAVHAFPTFLFDRGVEVGPFMTELLDKAQDSGFVPGREETLHEVLDMMACKAAIKAGNKLSETELAELLSMRERIERSSNCPHGRPTSIRVTIKELERRFGRV